jgi:DNA-directed RNA polymerase specialized sigma subunit
VPTLHHQIKQHIHKLIKPLKEEEELLSALKKRLTKKELKLLKAWAQEMDQATIERQLHITQERYEQLSSKLIKKLNHEQTKQMLYCEGSL